MTHRKNQATITIIFALFIILIAIFSVSCSKSIQRFYIVNPETLAVEDNTGGCIDIYGLVLGDIIYNSSVYLFQISSFEYETVMRTVRSNDHIRQGTVNSSDEFYFSCLEYGNYALSIPATSYANNSVGPPIPFEFEDENTSLKIIFHGGDYNHLVAAFSSRKKETN